MGVGATVETACGTGDEQTTCTRPVERAAARMVSNDDGAFIRHDAWICAVTWNEAVRVAADAIHASVSAMATAPARIVHSIAIARSPGLSFDGRPRRSRWGGNGRRMPAAMLCPRAFRDGEMV